MQNTNLYNAKAAKNDEFYTQYVDIQKEINAYLDFDPDVFRGKTVLLPCDDPEWSNFTKFFAQNFELLGLKKLVSTSYAPDSKKYRTAYQPTLFESEAPQFDSGKTQTHGKIFVLTHDVTGDNRVDINDLQYSYLEGDGDFRSREIRTLRDEADIIVTNPPFSLFREFYAWVMEAGKKFIIVCNKNCITYKEVFPDVKDNKVWSGKTEWAGGMWFETKNEEDVDKVVEGVNMKNTPSIWITNIDHGRRHEPLRLMTAADNFKHSKHKEIRERKCYEHYDNYDAIEVPYTDAIPSDYTECLGVPVSFLDKYCPDQFRIIGATESEGRGFSCGLWDPESGVAQALINGQRIYKRLFIKAVAPPLKAMSVSELQQYVMRQFGYTAAEVQIFSGIMGVPISFLDKYCPWQFEILGITKTWYGMANKIYPDQIQIGKDGKKSKVTKLNDGPVLRLNEPPSEETYYMIDEKCFTQTYARVLIRHKQ